MAEECYDNIFVHVVFEKRLRSRQLQDDGSSGQISMRRKNGRVSCGCRGEETDDVAP